MDSHFQNTSQVALKLLSSCLEIAFKLLSNCLVQFVTHTVKTIKTLKISYLETDFFGGVHPFLKNLMNIPRSEGEKDGRQPQVGCREGSCGTIA